METPLISGLVIVSEGERLCYPYLESIQSFLPVVDEMVVVYNRYKDDGSKDKIADLGEKIRLIPSIFDIDRFGWTSYAFARTLGYQACRGNVVAMFDADGILHEKQRSTLTKRLHLMTQQNPIYYWGKYRIYQKDRYWIQHKHSGIYYKKELMDYFHFFADKGKGVPCTADIPFEFKAKQIDVNLYGYEHLWDTKEVLMEKIVRYGKMLGMDESPEERYKNYVSAVKSRLKEQGKSFSITDHPKIIRDKLESMTPDMFGYNLGDNW